MICISINVLELTILFTLSKSTIPFSVIAKKIFILFADLGANFCRILEIAYKSYIYNIYFLNLKNKKIEESILGFF